MSEIPGPGVGGSIIKAYIAGHPLLALAALAFATIGRLRYAIMALGALVLMNWLNFMPSVVRHGLDFNGLAAFETPVQIIAFPLMGACAIALAARGQRLGLAAPAGQHSHAVRRAGRDRLRNQRLPPRVLTQHQDQVDFRARPLQELRARVSMAQRGIHNGFGITVSPTDLARRARWRCSPRSALAGAGRPLRGYRQAAEEPDRRHQGQLQGRQHRSICRIRRRRNCRSAAAAATIPSSSTPRRTASRSRNSSTWSPAPAPSSSRCRRTTP